MTANLLLQDRSGNRAQAITVGSEAEKFFGKKKINRFVFFRPVTREIVVLIFLLSPSSRLYSVRAD